MSTGHVIRDYSMIHSKNPTGGVWQDRVDLFINYCKPVNIKNAQCGPVVAVSRHLHIVVKKPHKRNITIFPNLKTGLDPTIVESDTLMC